MKEVYKDTYIYKVCKELEMSLKDFAYKMNRTHKCIENWKKDENSIPAREKDYISMLIQNKKLKDELRSLEKHKFLYNSFVESDEFGSIKLNITLQNGSLKRLKEYKVIFEEV